MSYQKKYLLFFALHFFVSVISFSVTSCGKEEKPVISAPEVQVTKAVKMDVPVTGEWVGQTLGAVDIEIKARTNGWLQGIHFREGSEVHQGALLYTIDATELQQKVAESEGQVASVKTMLAQAEADVKRYTPLAEAGAVSKRELEIAVANYKARMGQLEASLASLNLAKINLGYCNITAPVSGLIGISNARVGDFVGHSANSIVLNTISRVDSIHVRFSISEQEYIDLIRRFDKIKESLKGKKREIEMILSDGSVYPQKGVISFAQRQIDAATGTLQFEASFPNAERLLRPGQFAKIRIVIDEKKDAVVIPSRSIFEIQGQKTVYVVDDANKVVLRVVKTGPTYNNNTVIESGVNIGENVIYEGVLKVKPEVIVKPIEANIPMMPLKTSKEK
jgi:membrane fusion protein (multidrug efflux system)